MQKQTILTYLILVIAPIFTFGQSTFQENLFKKSVEFSVHILNAQPVGVIKGYPNQENDVTPNNSFAFQASLIRHTNLTSKLSLQTGLVGGVSAMKFTLNLTEQFRSLGRDGFNDYFNEFEFPYVGLNVGINYIVNSSEKNLFTAGISLNGIYIINTGFGYSIGAANNSGNSKNLLSADFEVAKANRLVILPQVEIAYHRNINPQLSFKGAIVGAFSNYNYIDSTYTIHGDNQDLVGKFTKKLNHVGISVGLIYALEKRGVTP